MLSHAGSQIGHGWAFGLNEFLDQTGATIGPLIMALVLYFHGGYHKAFGDFIDSRAVVSGGCNRAARIFLSAPA